MNELIKNGHEITYKLLSIGTIKFNGIRYVQVHCDRRDIQYSRLFTMEELSFAISRYFILHKKYTQSEVRYGSFPPFEGNIDVSK